MAAASAQEFEAAANHDEAAVRPYALPDPLLAQDGTRIESAPAWRTRRNEIFGLFRDHVFGSAPDLPEAPIIPVTDEAAGAPGGLALRREIAVRIAPGAPALNLLLYLPAGGDGPAPLALGPNFLGNHTVADDPGIRIFDIDMDGSGVTPPDGLTGEAARGVHADRWQVWRILGRGYAFATFHYGDLYPDRPDGAARSIQPFVDPGGVFTWGALATWAWSMRLALDALAAQPEIDSSRVMLFGHSRHGKAALWAGALDERFRIVVANNSGAGGASLMRRNFGESLADLVTRFPHWFAKAYRQYAGDEARLPVDQHMLLALIAPRPVYVASAVDDLWADPKGEFLGALGADPVYRLLGTSGLPARDPPPLETPVMGAIGYHIRRGGHGVTAYDWERFLDFADLHFGRAAA